MARAEEVRFINGNNSRDRRLRETVTSLGGVKRFGSKDNQESESYDEYLKDGICDFTCNGTYPGNFPYFTLLITIAQIGTFTYYSNAFPATDISKFNPYTKCGHLIISPYHQEQGFIDTFTIINRSETNRRLFNLTWFYRYDL